MKPIRPYDHETLNDAEWRELLASRDRERLYDLATKAVLIFAAIILVLALCGVGDYLVGLL